MLHNNRTTYHPTLRENALNMTRRSRPVNCMLSARVLDMLELEFISHNAQPLTLVGWFYDPRNHFWFSGTDNNQTSKMICDTFNIPVTTMKAWLKTVHHHELE